MPMAGSASRSDPTAPASLTSSALEVLSRRAWPPPKPRAQHLEHAHRDRRQRPHPPLLRAGRADARRGRPGVVQPPPLHRGRGALGRAADPSAGHRACPSAAFAPTPTWCAPAAATRTSASRCWRPTARPSSAQMARGGAEPRGHRRQDGPLPRKGLRPDADSTTRQRGPRSSPSSGLGCMGMSEFYGDGRRARVDRHAPPRARARRHLPRHRRHVRPGTNEELVGRAIARPPRRVVLATKFGIVREPEGDRSARCSTAGRSTCARPCDALAAAARRRPHRPLLPAPRGPRRRRSRRRSARWPSSCSEGKVRYLGLSEAAPGDDPPRARRAPDHRAADRVLAVGRDVGGRASCRRCASSGSASCPTARSGAASSTGRSAARRPRRGRLPAAHPALPGRELRREPARSSTRVARARRAQGRDARRSSRSPGCSPRATTSCRSPAPSAAATSRRTWRRSTWSSAAPTSRIDESPLGAARGDRYADMARVNL